MTDAGIPMGEVLPCAAYWQSECERIGADAIMQTSRKVLMERAFEAGLAFADTPPPAAAGDRSLAEALDRQTDNMAFILNRVGLPAQWLAKLERELAEDRAILALRTPEPNSGGEADHG